MMKLAVILPAYNEELVIQKVMEEFHRAVPDAEIVVVDNNSRDQTTPLARATMDSWKTGTLLFQPLQGKGQAMRLAFHEIDADVYVMVDADLTYAASDLALLLKPVLDGRADMVVGDRLSEGLYRQENKRSFHNFGNSLVRTVINVLFKAHLKDVMSGYRVMTRSFVKNFPIVSQGFDLETEMTIHALTYGFRIQEIGIHYQDRPAGSFSKLNTLSDGWKVLAKITSLFVTNKPLLSFSIAAVIFWVAAVLLGWGPITEYFSEGFVKKVPSFVAAMGVGLVGLLTFFVGLILEYIRADKVFAFRHRWIRMSHL
jgi:glycosyltransferase involved in cell wall biosynthesis